MCGNGPGGPAIQLDRSSLVLARTTVRGGHGADGCHDTWYSGRNGAPGGPGIVANSSNLLVLLGSASDVVRGGDGGDGFSLSDNQGGDDGTGLVVQGGNARVSRLALQGGAGGRGTPRGKDGSPYTGNVSRDDRYPYLDLDGPVNPGDPVVLTVSTVASGQVVLIVAQVGGQLVDPFFIGAPFSALPGGYFFVIPLGHAIGGTDFTRTLPVPADPVVRGLVINAQALILGDAGESYLANAIDRVVGD